MCVCQKNKMSNLQTMCRFLIATTHKLVTIILLHFLNQHKRKTENGWCSAKFMIGYQRKMITFCSLELLEWLRTLFPHLQINTHPPNEVTKLSDKKI